MSTNRTSGPFPETEAILDALEAAFESDWLEDMGVAELPTDLQDALKVRERGRALLEKGFCWSDDRVGECSEGLDAEYRAAARNGRPIPEAVLERMHAEREEAEHQALNK
jgi:hypothetical protein